jgi:BirA family biotin operon repressor/biotin-[acetyl-CoA-carboxylase] ligase
VDFQVEWFDRLASTNAHLRACCSAQPPPPSGQIIAAHEQTAGRGRQDRKWFSAPHQDLCFSLFLKTQVELMAIPSLTMATALAVNDLLRSLNIFSTPKWPNDVLVGDKKICGILSERVDPHGIIIGIGLNINMNSEEAAAIDRPATSMLIESGKPHDIAQTLEALFPPLDYWINEWEKGGFPALRETWIQQAGPIGKSLSVHDGDLRKTGTLAGFGDHGELLLKTEHGIETIWTGEIPA